MRLIDGDVLTDYVTKVYEYDLCHTDADDYTEGRACAEHGVLEKIQELPTIDAIPVEWLEEQRDKLSEAWDEEWHEINGLIEQWRKEQEAR